MARGKKLLVACIVLSIASLVLQIAGFISPGWEFLKIFVTTSSGVVADYRQYGLWYTCTRDGCVAGLQEETCK